MFKHIINKIKKFFTKQENRIELSEEDAIIYLTKIIDQIQEGIEHEDTTIITKSETRPLRYLQ